MTEQELVKKCLADIYQRNGYEDLSNLTQRDYEHVSQEIENSTGTLISASTIKRLLHGDFSRLPQTATLNAVSKYLGYKSWQEYKAYAKNTAAISSTGKENGASHDIHKTPPARFNPFTLVAFGFLLIGAVMLFVFIGFSPKRTPSNFDKATFSARKNTSNEIPNTVVFHYNIDPVEADSFFIQQSWDVSRRVRVFKKNYTLTDIYYEPGYHQAKLIANDSIIKTVDVSIPTDRWFFFAKDIRHGSRPDYIKTSGIGQDGLLGLDTNVLVSNHIDAQTEKNYLYTFFPSNIEVNSDNYVFRTRIRMKEVRNNHCPAIMLEIFCQRNFMFFQSTPKGCSSESMVQFGENFISGKKSDLSSLGFDVTQWTDVEVIVKNKQVRISLDHREVFATSYQKSSGLITGLGFISNGLCQVDFVELKGLDGKPVYQSDFSSQ